MKKMLFVPLALAAALAGGAAARVEDQCGPFTDVNALFCPYVLEAYYTGITAGTSATTFSPDQPITRGQAAVFSTKTLNQALTRGSRRAALGQWWTTAPQYGSGLEVTPLDTFIGQPCSDGADLWVPSLTGNVYRVRASDGKLLDTWTAPGASNALCAIGKVFVTGQSNLYMIDPAGPAGPATKVVDSVGRGAASLAFDGSRIWTANPVGLCACDPYPPGSVSIVTPGSWTVQTVDLGAVYPYGMVFDGASIWIATGSLLRLDSNGAVVQTVAPGAAGNAPVFDGTNIWSPNADSSSVSVVRASTGEVVATLTGNGLSHPVWAAFDGRRVLVLSNGGIASLWDAQSLAPLGMALRAPYGGVAAASDGIDFWLTLSDFQNTGALARF